MAAARRRAALAWMAAAASVRGVGSVDLCYSRYEQSAFANNASRCPSACPYQLVCAENPLIESSVEEGIRCVRKPDCASLLRRGYAMNSTSCGVCALQGCERCHENRELGCAKCSSRFELQADGTCYWLDTIFWNAVLGVIVILVSWVTIDFIVAHCLGTVNRESLAQGLEARWRAKVRKYWEEDVPQYNLFKARMNFPPVDEPPICGPGTSLFMNWFCLIIVVSLWLTLCAYVWGPSQRDAVKIDTCYRVEPEAPDVVAQWNMSGNSYQIAERAGLSKEELRVWAKLSFVGAAVISAIFFIWQTEIWSRLVHDEEGKYMPGMVKPYCIHARGFPKETPNRSKIMEFIREELKKRQFDGDAVDHISIAYNLSGEVSQQVNHAINEYYALLDLLNRELADRGRRDTLEHYNMQRELKPSDSRTSLLVSSSDSFESGSDAEDASVTEHVKCPQSTFWVQVLAYAMVGSHLQLGPCKLEGYSMQKTEPVDSELDLDELESTGHVFIVFKSAEVAAAMGQKKQFSLLYDGEHEIFCDLCHDDPQGIMWENFQYDYGDKRVRIGISILVIGVCGIAWFLFYLPFLFVYGYVFDTEFTGDSAFTSIMFESCCGLLIAVGNCMISFVCVLAVDRMGFRMKSKADLAYLTIVIPCVTLNCAMDFFVVLYFVTTGTEGSQPDTTRLLHEEWLALIMPSYVFTPYFGEPVFTLLLPYLLGIWRIKRDVSVTGSQAEEIMKAGEVDQVNPPYGDMITVFSVIIGTFVFSPGHYHVQLFSLACAWGLLLYWQNRIRILYWQAYSWFGHDYLHTCESLFWSLPIGLLCSKWGFYESDRQEGQEWKSGVWYMIIYVILHIAFCEYVVPVFRRRDKIPCVEPYSDYMVRNEKKCLATYLNTNPVEVLRSINDQDMLNRLGVKASLDPGDPEREKYRNLVFYRNDKLYLQPAAVKTFHGVVQSDDEVDMPIYEGAKDLLGHGVEGARDLFTSVGSNAQSLRLQSLRFKANSTETEESLGDG